jgi:DNA-binding response OmpR family regulator
MVTSPEPTIGEAGRDAVADGPPYRRPVPVILLVEDDAAIAEPLARSLRRDGHDVRVVGSGREAIDQVDGARIDLVILDLGLPDMDGLEVCRQIRRVDARLPVLVLTARSDELDVVVGLDSGADDYVTKPFRLAELSARVRSRLRGAEPDVEITAQDVQIDVAARRTTVAGHELELTPKEFDLLSLLARNAGQVVTKQRIMRDVWETDWFGSTKTIDVHVAALRRKLGDDSSSPTYITTVRGVGLRFETGAT